MKSLWVASSMFAYFLLLPSVLTWKANIDGDDDDDGFNVLTGQVMALEVQMTWSRSIWWYVQNRTLSPDLSVVLSLTLVRVAFKELVPGGSLGGSTVWHVEGVILESRDRVPHCASCMEPASPSAYVSASLSLSHEEINKILKKVERRIHISNKFPVDTVVTVHKTTF